MVSLLSLLEKTKSSNELENKGNCCDPPRGEFITCAEIATDNFQCFIIHTGGYLKEKFWEINNNDAPASFGNLVVLLTTLVDVLYNVKAIDFSI